jgi:uncharacterized protein (DUF849 family)
MEQICEMVRESGTKPELEVYDVGHLYNVRYLLDQGLLDTPIHIQFVLGVMGANAARLDQFMHMLRTATDLFGSGSPSPRPASATPRSSTWRQCA